MGFFGFRYVFLSDSLPGYSECGLGVSKIFKGKVIFRRRAKEQMRKVILFCFLALWVFKLNALGGEIYYLPVMGQSIHIFDQSVGEKKQWYINDHCIIKARDGIYHLFGITHTKEIIPPSWAEHTFAHASSDELLKIPWHKNSRVLDIDKKIGETHLWAPHIIEKDGIYYMFYAGGGGHFNSMVNLATSRDLFNWEKADANPLF